MKHTISIIIPAFNEEHTIRYVLETAVAWGKAREILVVNDGSTDKTSEVVQSFRPNVRLIQVGSNKGKGNALACGAKAATSDIIFFADADIIGLTVSNIEELVAPVRDGKADMVIGLHNFWGIGLFRPYNRLSGQRVLWRNRLMPYLSQLRSSKGGAEFVINRVHSKLRVVSIDQPTVKTLKKLDKWPLPYALWAYIKQGAGFVRGHIISRRI